MRNRIERYIPKAITAIESTGIARNGEVPSQFNGYIASFGASVRQGGLLATVLFYKNENSGSEEDRSKVVSALAEILGKPGLVDSGGRKVLVTRDEVDDAAVALKLAVRTFRLVEKKE
jgi:CRISPR-associated protein Cmr5